MCEPGEHSEVSSPACVPPGPCQLEGCLYRGPHPLPTLTHTPGTHSLYKEKPALERRGHGTSSHRLSLLPGAHGALTSTGHHTTASCHWSSPAICRPQGRGRQWGGGCRPESVLQLAPSSARLGSRLLALPPQRLASQGGFPRSPQIQHPSGSTSLPGPRASGRARRPQITFPVLAHTGVLRAALWRQAGEMAGSVLGPTFSAFYRQQGTSQLHPACPQSSAGCRRHSKAPHGTAGALSPPSIHTKQLHSGPPRPRSPPRLPHSVQ